MWRSVPQRPASCNAYFVGEAIAFATTAESGAAVGGCVRQVQANPRKLERHAPPNMTDANLQALVDFLIPRDRLLRRSGPQPECAICEANGHRSFTITKATRRTNRSMSRCAASTSIPADCFGRCAGRIPRIDGEGVSKTGTEHYGGLIATVGDWRSARAPTQDNQVRRSARTQATSYGRPSCRWRVPRRGRAAKPTAVSSS